MPAATVTATNIATNAKTVQQTTESGFYSIAALAAGQYTLNVTATGFQSVTQEKVLVDALAVITVNLSLQVGSVGETITVSSAPLPLNTADATLGSNMRNELYTALPLAMSWQSSRPDGLRSSRSGGSRAWHSGGRNILCVFQRRPAVFKRGLYRRISHHDCGRARRNQVSFVWRFRRSH